MNDRRTRSPRVRVAALAAALVASGGLGVIGAGCGDGGAPDATSGARITLHARAATDPASLATFTTGFGWKVKLEAAAVAVGAIYYFDGPPAFDDSLARAPGLLDRLLSVPSAHAHPGHYQAGDALAQMLTPTSVDAFAPAPLPDATGITGTYRSARVVLGAKPAGPAASALGGHAAMARGTAERADGTSKEPIHFVVTTDFAEVAKSVVSGEVDGCVVAEAPVDADGTVTMTLKPSVWLDFVDFTGVAPGTAAAPTVVPHGEIAQIGFTLGVVQLRAYAFAYAKGGAE
jgi:hypothetical protein